MNPIIPENKKISPGITFFLIHSMQIGIGVLGFQRIIAKTAGYDAWISILFTGLCIHLVLWMIYKMLSVGGDFYGIHQFIFGKRISSIVSFLFILYFCLLAVTVLRNYIEVVQVWMFSELKTFWLALAFLLVVIYIIHGGFRTVAGIAFFSVTLTAYIWLLFLFAIPFSDFTNFLPLMNHSVKDLLMASRDMTLSVIGFEVLLFFYPFIKKPEKSKKYGHLAVFATMMICLYLALIAFAYFPEEQLEKNIWATLTMWKIIELPFVERFEFIGIANWCLIILPNICIALWCASRLTKQIFSISQRKSVYFYALVCLIATSLLLTRNQINFVSDMVSTVGFYFSFVYIPLLFLATLIAKKVKSK